MFASRYQPMFAANREFNRLNKEFDRLFGHTGVDQPPGFGANLYPPLNMWEDESSWYVEAELPGYDLSDLEIYFTCGNQLTLKGERKPPQLSQGKWHRQERGYGAFHRVLELPGQVDSDQIAAEFNHGVLTITMPKSAAVKPRRIAVTRASEGTL